LWIGIAIGAQVLASNLITKGISKDLSVAQLDGCNDADNFLTPVQDIFQFLEDGMTVRIGQAMGSGDFVTSGILLKWAGLGGFACGLVGAIISTIFTYIYAIYSFFVPTALSSSLPTSCAVIPSIAEIQADARPYWILVAFTWPALFINKATIGFFNGTGETLMWTIATVVSCAFQLAIFYIFIHTSNKTTIYGLSVFVPAYVFLLITILCFLRKKFIDQFKFLVNNMFTKDGLLISWQAARDGMHLLLKDLALTLQKSCSLIMAAHLGLGQQYQLLLYNNLQSIFGFSYGSQNQGSIFPIALGYGMRLAGSRLLGARKFEPFVAMFKAYFIGCVLFGFISFITIITKRTTVPYYFVSNGVCKYQEYQCSKSTYDHIFHNIDPGMIILSVMAWNNSIYSILSATLYATLDFTYIRNTTLIVFVIVYIPLACLGYLYFKSALALYVAQNVPVVVLTIIYAFRLFYTVIPNIETWISANDSVSKPEMKKSLSANAVYGNVGAIVNDEAQENQENVSTGNSNQVELQATNNDNNDNEERSPLQL